MGAHTVTTVLVLDNQWVGQCSCRHRGKVETSQWEARKWTLAHLAEVERVRMHSKGHRATLDDQRDYFRKMALDTGLPAEQRALWDQLAGELDRRLGDAPGYPEHEQTELF